jgi:ComF family protein
MSDPDHQLDKTNANSSHGASFAFYSGSSLGASVGFFPRLKKAVQVIGFSTLDLIYPTLCVNCERVGSLLCDYCIDLILPADTTILPSPTFTDYTAVGQHKGPLQNAVIALKYENERRMGSLLGRLLADAVLEKEWQIDTVIPVPLHAARLAERGYNQANEIAKGVAAEIGSTLASDALYRVQETQSQVTLSAVERRHNVEEAFIVAESYQQRLKNQTILLIDDVCTTGSTLAACTVKLREAEATAVYVATVSRAAFPISGVAEDALQG